MVPPRRFDDDFSDIIRKKQSLENHGENDKHECSKNLPLPPKETASSLLPHFEEVRWSTTQRVRSNRGVTKLPPERRTFGGYIGGVRMPQRESSPVKFPAINGFV
jgi:hypothetical protein